MLNKLVKFVRTQVGNVKLMVIRQQYVPVESVSTKNNENLKCSSESNSEAGL